jgi:hypothetical protein
VLVPVVAQRRLERLVGEPEADLGQIDDFVIQRALHGQDLRASLRDARADTFGSGAADDDGDPLAGLGR